MSLCIHILQKCFYNDRHTKDLHSLKCQERQMQKLIDLIRTALNEVSCEELPSGCDDLSVDMENSSPEQTVRSQTLINFWLLETIEENMSYWCWNLVINMVWDIFGNYS